MTLVRRARKNIRERRMKACLNDLTTNLSKVETKVFLKQKQEREKKRKAMGVLEVVPKSILAGQMTPELYAIECRLHEEVGLPKPIPYSEYAQDVGAPKGSSSKKTPLLGFLPFSVLLTAVQARYGGQESPEGLKVG